MTPRNNQLSIEAIISAARPVQRNDVFAKAKKVAELLGEEVDDRDDKGFVSAFVCSKDELTISYFVWGDLTNHGFGVAIHQGEEPVFAAGTQKIIIYKPGPWEEKLDRLHKPYVINN